MLFVCALFFRQTRGLRRGQFSSIHIYFIYLSFPAAFLNSFVVMHIIFFLKQYSEILISAERKRIYNLIDIIKITQELSKF